MSVFFGVFAFVAALLGAVPLALAGPSTTNSAYGDTLQAHHGHSVAECSAHHATGTVPTPSVSEIEEWHSELAEAAEDFEESESSDELAWYNDDLSPLRSLVAVRARLRGFRPFDDTRHATSIGPRAPPTVIQPV